ncbi:MAG TPA: hypothetical protein VIH22_15570, partial [Cyclobacteriaceae bacterium]
PNLLDPIALNKSNRRQLSKPLLSLVGEPNGLCPYGKQKDNGKFHEPARDQMKILWAQVEFVSAIISVLPQQDSLDYFQMLRNAL